jgi:hypothetical protein
LPNRDRANRIQSVRRQLPCPVATITLSGFEIAG